MSDPLARIVSRLGPALRDFGTALERIRVICEEHVRKEGALKR